MTSTIRATKKNDSGPVKSAPINFDSIRNMTIRTKKLDLEFLTFEMKSTFFLIQTISTGKLSKEAEFVDVKLSDGEKDAYKTLFKKFKKSKISTTQKNIDRIKEFMEPHYTLHREMLCSLETNKPKKNVLVRLKEMFDDFNFDSSVIFMTGSATKHGAVLFESPEFGEEEMILSDIVGEWKKRTSKQKYLLIIIDTNFAGRWALDVKKLDVTDVGVIASCKEKEKSMQMFLGTVFVHNFLKYLNKSELENLLPCESSPIFAGDFLKCKIYTNFYCHFKDWETMIPIQKSDFMEIKYENGRYIGYVANAQKGFWGAFIWTTGSYENCKYVGEFRNGQLEGQGIMYYKSGRVYKGDFILNAPDGTGEENYENGDHYKGKYKKGFKSGMGTYTYKNGDVYKGEFVENKPEGKGKLVLANKSHYDGQFKGGKCWGKGTFTYNNGDVYKGEWQNSLKHGNGKYWYVNGDVYDGQFVNGIRHGQGILKSKNGDVYNGQWELDAMSGAGEFTTEHSKTTGEWVKGNITKQPTFYQKMGTQTLKVKLT